MWLDLLSNMVIVAIDIWPNKQESEVNIQVQNYAHLLVSIFYFISQTNILTDLQNLS